MPWFDVEVEEHQLVTWRVEAKDRDEAEQFFAEGEIVSKSDLEFQTQVVNVTEADIVDERR